MSKQMLILVGPQGAGNHLWSKIFSLHPDVYGWKSLLENYWEPHRVAEPFAQCWRDHNLLEKFDWSQSDYYFTSISCPLGIIGSTENPIWNPNPGAFIQAVVACGIDIEIAVLGRDQTILDYQQTRIRTEPTIQMFKDRLANTEHSVKFLSYELLYLYKQDYLRSLDFNIPIAYTDARINDILSNDANAKYIHTVEYNELDLGNKKGVTFKTKP